MDIAKIRKESWKIAEKLGYPVNEKLPLMDLPLNLREEKVIGRRMLALKAALAVAFSSENGEMVKKWILQENLSECLSKTESLLVFEGKGDAEKMELGIESLWMLAWSVGLIKEMNYREYCGDFLSDLLPSIENMDTTVPFMRNLLPRSIEAVTEELDLAYCLNWGMVQARREGQPPPGDVREYVIEYRRKALEWIVSEESWDNVLMS